MAARAAAHAGPGVTTGRGAGAVVPVRCRGDRPPGASPCRRAGRSRRHPVESRDAGGIPASRAGCAAASVSGSGDGCGSGRGRRIMMPCILVFGMPRSGTTWVGKLFDSHPDTLYRHEPDSARQLDVPMFAGMGADAGCHRRQLEKFVASMPRLRAPRVVGKRPLFPKHYQSAAGLLAYRASVAAAKVAGRVRRDFPCPYRPAATHHGRARLVWKSIESPGRLGACMTALPQARAVYLMRHPCGYVASVLRGRRGHHLGAAAASDPFWHMKLLLATPAGRAHGLELDDIRRLAPEEQLAWRWVLTQETVLSDVAGS